MPRASEMKKRPASERAEAEVSGGQPAPSRRRRKSGEEMQREHLVRVGTAGFAYTQWRGSFYPSSLKISDEFGYYARDFNAVELNTTFYGTPSVATFDSWRERAAAVSHAEPFLYTLKANQFFTHRKQLNVDEVFTSRWRDFWTRCQHLKNHLGCVLFQLPPRFALTKTNKDGLESPRPTLQRFMDLGALLPRGGRFAFEFRHPSWFEDPDVHAVFRRFNWCMCLVECCNEDGWAGALASGSSPAPERYPVTCDWGVYFRFHGASGQYVGKYGAARMRRWAAHLNRAKRDASMIAFAFFNNTDDGDPLPSAIVDARSLRDEMQAF